MERNTFDATLKAFKYRKPFQPFTVALVDGHRVEVDHPRMRSWCAMAWRCSPVPAACR
jgi:hypothetical protein